MSVNPVKNFDCPPFVIFARRFVASVGLLPAEARECGLEQKRRYRPGDPDGVTMGNTYDSGFGVRWVAVNCGSHGDKPTWKTSCHPGKPDGEPERANLVVAANCCLHRDKPGWKAIDDTKRCQRDETSSSAFRKSGEYP